MTPQDPLYTQANPLYLEEHLSVPLELSIKLCATCMVEKTWDNFYKNKASKYGISSQCKDCILRKQNEHYSKNRQEISRRRKKLYAENREEARYKEKEYRNKNKEKYENNRKIWNSINQEKCLEHRLRSRFKLFGANKEWYDQTLAEQGGGCAICGSDDSKTNGKRFAIDHNHSCCGPNKACAKCRRGLLCAVCNTRLAYLENEKWKRQAMAYLNKYRKDGKKFDEAQGSLFDL